MTYADEDSVEQFELMRWELDGNNLIRYAVWTNNTNTGEVFFGQRAGGVLDRISEGGTGSYSPGANVPFNIAGAHTSSRIQGAVNGTALTADTTPTSLVDLSSSGLRFSAKKFMGHITQFRIWDVDIGDTGIEEASS